MCGIVGILNLDSPFHDRALLESMTSRLAHRGPDGQHVFLSGPVGLGHSRLAILDLSEAGRQPMSNEDNTIWVTCNGEIYNWLPLRSELEAKGHVFRSRSDNEVIIHAYEEWGVDCVDRLRGMFAFGLWDALQQRLWLVRDRLGIKPLFYARLPRVILFASEIKALLSYPGLDRSIDHGALSYYLALNYTPAPYTLFRGVRQLLPGYSLLMDVSGIMTEREYWDIDFVEDVDKSESEWVKGFGALLEETIREHLMSDVPFGAFLSGGLDSSSVTYWMAENLTNPVKTFTVGFNESTFDETPYARQVADFLVTEHHETTVQPNAADLLPKLVWHAEEPTADSSMMPLYLLARQARRHVKMVLCGDGGDEILAGYETYQAFFALHLLKLVPAWLRQGLLARLVNALPVSDNKLSWDFKLRRFVQGQDFSPEDAHATWRMIFTRDAREQLLSPVWDRPGADADVIDLYRSYFARTKAQGPLNRLLYVDTKLYLPNDMLVKVDRMTMAHGLEARVPFLDHRLVEYAACVPPKYKMRYLFKKKHLLKKVMVGRVPKAILRRPKAGFNVPTARWFRHDLKPFVMDVLSPSTLQEIGLFDLRFIEALLKQHFTREADNSHQIWCLLTLSLWWRRFQSLGSDS
jgi:asparagine synthase (glutamine-hydrolysing)